MLYYKHQVTKYIKRQQENQRLNNVIKYINTKLHFNFKQVKGTLCRDNEMKTDFKRSV